MENDWPTPRPLEDWHGLLAGVDTEQMPHARQFAACLQKLAESSDDTYSWTPYIASIGPDIYEMHANGHPGGSADSSIPVGNYHHLDFGPEYICTVIQYLGTTPEHFMAFAQVLSGQHVATSDTGPAGPDAYVTPIDWAYQHLAFDKGMETGSPSGQVRESVADFGELNGAMQAVIQSGWDSDAKEAALDNLISLMNFLIYIRGPLHAELGATVVAYAALIESARKQLNELMAHTVAALRRLEQGQDADPVKVAGTLLALAGFIPGLPYAITFGIGLASMAISTIESQAKAKETPQDFAIPGARSHSCVDILNWYLEKARDTCEQLSGGIGELTKRLPALLGEVMSTVPADKHVHGELRQLPT
ncbi:hypothetical protein L3Q67_28500 [Saccharothrix sp. AJ9571]|nr:hypothetical protein L3Q67_28500 [Saccharothrix sp. AJ9571]